MRDERSGQVVFRNKNKTVYFYEYKNKSAFANDIIGNPTAYSAIELGAGGTASVYKVPAGAFSVQFAIKIYSDKILSEAGSAIDPFLRSLIEFRKNLPENTRRVIYQYTAWPQCLVYDYDSGRVCGFTMQPISELYFIKMNIAGEEEIMESNLDFVLHGNKYRRKRGLPELTRNGRAKIVGDYLKIISTLHEYDYVLGDLSPKNTFISIDGNDQNKNSVFMIDNDSYRNKVSINPLKQLHTPDWIPPECMKASNELSKLTPNANPYQISRLKIDSVLQNHYTDVYKMCLAITRLYHDGEHAAIITASESADLRIRKEISDEFANLIKLGLSETPEERPSASTIFQCFNNLTIVKAEEERKMSEKYNLLIFILDEQSTKFNSSQEEFRRVKQQYAHYDATLVLIFVDKVANRVISGQPISEIDEFPPFDDTDGKQDVVNSIHRWVYEAQCNVYSINPNKIRTAVFVDVSDEVISRFNIVPHRIVGSLVNIDYYEKTKRDEGNIYTLVAVSSIDKLKVLTESEDENAQYKLGLAYINGDGVDKDLLTARSFFLKSSLRGNREALFAMVDLFEEPDKYSCEKAASLGHVKAQWLTGKRYYNYFIRGEGTDVDLEKAEYWLKKAGEQGHIEALNLLKTISELRSEKVD